MFVIVGATGKTGSAALVALVRVGQPVRGIVRRPDQADLLRSRGAEAALADVEDVDALTSAFAKADAIYLMNPSAYRSGHVRPRS